MHSGKLAHRSDAQLRRMATRSQARACLVMLGLMHDPQRISVIALAEQLGPAGAAGGGTCAPRLACYHRSQTRRHAAFVVSDCAMVGTADRMCLVVVRPRHWRWCGQPGVL